MNPTSVNSQLYIHFRVPSSIQPHHMTSEYSHGWTRLGGTTRLQSRLMMMMIMVTAYVLLTPQVRRRRQLVWRHHWSAIRSMHIHAKLNQARRTIWTVWKYKITSAAPSRLRRSMRCACRPLVFSSSARWARGRGLERRSLTLHHHL